MKIQQSVEILQMLKNAELTTHTEFEYVSITVMGIADFISLVVRNTEAI